MLYNVVIDISVNVLLTIVWDGEHNHQAYWHLVATHPNTGNIAQMIDGPFPNQYMAAADIFKRYRSLQHFKVVPLFNDGVAIETVWAAKYGVNFKRAFGALPPNSEDIEGVYASAVF